MTPEELASTLAGSAAHDAQSDTGNTTRGGRMACGAGRQRAQRTSSTRVGAPTHVSWLACLCAARHLMRPVAGLWPRRGVQTDAYPTHTPCASAPRRMRAAAPQQEDLPTWSPMLSRWRGTAPQHAQREGLVLTRAAVAASSVPVLPSGASTRRTTSCKRAASCCGCCCLGPPAAPPPPAGEASAPGSATSAWLAPACTGTSTCRAVTRRAATLLADACSSPHVTLWLSTLSSPRGLAWRHQD